MKTLALLHIILLLGVCNVLKGQAYDEGFHMLDSGDFKKALDFFKEKIENGNQDFTAKLCYGRALGLSGSSIKALEHFQEMKKEFPNSKELDINYAEALMWSARFSEAVSAYNSLYNRDSLNFAVVLGYANALSAIENYSSATHMINLALGIMPDNTNALTSKKYILLAWGNQLKLASKGKEAEKVYDELLIDFPEDIDVGLNHVFFLLDQNKLRQGEQELHQMLELGLEDYRIFSTISGIKLRELNLKKAKYYLDLAKATFSTNGERLPFDLVNLEVNVLLGMDQFKQVEEILANLDKDYDGVKRRELWFNYLMKKRDFKQLEEFLAGEEGDSYFASRAKVDLAKGHFISARKNLDSVSIKPETTSLHYYLGKEIEKQFHRNFGFGFQTMKDNGGTYAESYALNAMSSSKRRARFSFSYKQRKAYTKESLSASSKRLELGLGYQVHTKFNAQFLIARNDLENTLGATSAKLQFGSKFKYEFSNTHMLSFLFNQNAFNYNVELINKSITVNKFGVQYYNMFMKKFGGYLESNRSQLSDGNSSSFLFLSLFHNFKAIPIIQGGINYTFLNFDKKVGAYFSPTTYDVKEVFLKFDNTYHPNHKMILSVTLGVGSQDIENSDQQYTQRLEASMGYKIVKEQVLKVYYSYNNSASSTLSGYQARRFGLSLDLRF